MDPDRRPTQVAIADDLCTPSSTLPQDPSTAPDKDLPVMVESAEAAVMESLDRNTLQVEEATEAEVSTPHLIDGANEATAADLVALSTLPNSTADTEHSVDLPPTMTPVLPCIATSDVITKNCAPVPVDPQMYVKLEATAQQSSESMTEVFSVAATRACLALTSVPSPEDAMRAELLESDTINPVPPNDLDRLVLALNGLYSLPPEIVPPVIPLLTVLADTEVEEHDDM